MAGERPVQATEAIQPFSVLVNLQYPAAGDAVDQWVFWAEQDMVLDAASLKFHTASTSGTAQLVKGSDGQAIGLGTTNISDAASMSGTINTDVDFTITTTDNVIPAGSWVGINFNGTMTNLAGCAIQLRLRQKRR